eukprot:15333723-Ditylum_brightwellii.AAC.1
MQSSSFKAVGRGLHQFKNSTNPVQKSLISHQQQTTTKQKASNAIKQQKQSLKKIAKERNPPHLNNTSATISCAPPSGGNKKSTPVLQQKSPPDTPSDELSNTLCDEPSDMQPSPPTSMEGDKLATKSSTTNDEMDINEWGNSFDKVVEAAAVAAS